MWRWAAAGAHRAVHRPVAAANEGVPIPALKLRPLRELVLRAGSAPGRPSFLSAASGLVCTGDELCVVADDELHLGRFPVASTLPGKLLRLMPGSLPVAPALRKRRKADLEVLLRLPVSVEWPRGALLALGSGSRPRRGRGAWIALGSNGRVTGRAHPVDASALYARLASEVGELNIEGGWVSGESLFLLQRGNRGNAPNALIRFALQPMLSGIRHGQLAPLPPRMLKFMSLGDIDGVPLGFTDGTALPDGRWLFAAVAEDTANAYLDGRCAGAAIGLADARHRIQWLRRVEPPLKIEGIATSGAGNTRRLLLVSDADDPTVPAQLLTAALR